MIDYQFGHIGEAGENVSAGMEAFLTNRKDRFHVWSLNPPHRLGITVFLLVVLELVLGHRLFHNMGLNLTLIGQFTRTALLVLSIEGVLIALAHRTAYLFNKKGDISTTWTLLNIGLFPLLLFLPLTVFCWAGGIPGGVRLIAFLVLGMKVLSYWKEILESTYLFSRMQSAIILLTTGIFLWLVITVLAYASVLHSFILR